MITRLPVDCGHCGFTGVLVCDHEEYPEFCPACGLDGYGAASHIDPTEEEG